MHKSKEVINRDISINNRIQYLNVQIWAATLLDEKYLNEAGIDRNRVI